MGSRFFFFRGVEVRCCYFWIYLLVARFVWFRCFLEFLLGGFGVSTEMLAKGSHHIEGEAL